MADVQAQLHQMRVVAATNTQDRQEDLARLQELSQRLDTHQREQEARSQQLDQRLDEQQGVLVGLLKTSGLDGVLQTKDPCLIQALHRHYIACEEQTHTTATAGELGGLPVASCGGSCSACLAIARSVSGVSVQSAAHNRLSLAAFIILAQAAQALVEPRHDLSSEFLLHSH